MVHRDRAHDLLLYGSHREGGTAGNALLECHAVTDVSGPSFGSIFKGKAVPESFKSRTCCVNVRTLLQNTLQRYTAQTFSAALQNSSTLVM